MLEQLSQFIVLVQYTYLNYYAHPASMCNNIECDDWMAMINSSSHDELFSYKVICNIAYYL